MPPAVQRAPHTGSCIKIQALRLMDKSTDSPHSHPVPAKIGAGICCRHCSLWQYSLTKRQRFCRIPRTGAGEPHSRRVFHNRVRMPGLLSALQYNCLSPVLGCVRRASSDDAKNATCRKRHAACSARNAICQKQHTKVMQICRRSRLIRGQKKFPPTLGSKNRVRTGISGSFLKRRAAQAVIRCAVRSVRQIRPAR